MNKKKRFGEFGLVAGVALLMLVSSLSVLSHPASAALTPEWTMTYSMGTNRTQAVVVQDNSGLVYVIGGVEGMQGGGGYATPVAKVSSYNMTTGEWLSLAPMLKGVRGAAGAFLDGKIYVFTGVTTTKVQHTQIYDIAANAWSLGTNAPEAIWEAKAAVGGDGLIYVMGGERNSSSFSDVVNVYSPVGDSWSLGTPLTVGTKAGAAISSNGYYPVYIGGLTSIGPTSAVEQFYPYSGTWNSLSSMPAAAVGLAATIGADGFWYVFGGGTSDSNVGAGYNSTYYYNPFEAVWGTGPDMTTAARYLGAASSTDGRILALGGNNQTVVFNKVESMRVMSVSTVVSPATVGQGRSVTVSITAEFAFAVPSSYNVAASLVSAGVTYGTVLTNSPLPGTVAFVVTIPETVAPGPAEIYIYALRINYDSGSTSVPAMWLPITVTAAATSDQQITSLQQNITELQAKLNDTQAKLNDMNATQSQDNTALQNKLDSLQSELDKAKASASSSSMYGMIALVLLIVVIALVALMFMMSRKPKT